MALFFLYSFPCPFFSFFFSIKINYSSDNNRTRSRTRTLYACTFVYLYACTCTCICICICICTERERILKNLTIFLYIYQRNCLESKNTNYNNIYVQRITEWYNVVTTNLAGRSASTDLSRARCAQNSICMTQHVSVEKRLHRSNREFVRLLFSKWRRDRILIQT